MYRHDYKKPWSDNYAISVRHLEQELQYIYKKPIGIMK